MALRARGALEFVCRELRCHAPSLVWICPTSPALKSEPLKFDYEEELDAIVRLTQDTTGGFTPWNHSLHEVWILSTRDACPHLEFAIIHEVRHAYQKKFCRDVFEDPGRAEGDAYAFGYALVRRYFSSIQIELMEAIDRQEAETRQWFQSKFPQSAYGIVACGQHI